jgi:hypothetical protein
MNHYTRFAVPLILATITSISPVAASVSGRRNTAIGTSALALYELARGQSGTGLLAGAGAAYAWNQYNQAHRHTNRRHAFMLGYQAGVRRAYGARYRRHR